MRIHLVSYCAFWGRKNPRKVVYQAYLAASLQHPFSFLLLSALWYL